MEGINMLAEMGNKNPAAVLEGLIALQVLGGIAFIICSFVVAHTENVGFNVVLSGILNLVFAVASYYSLGKLKTPIIIGAVIGAGIMISFLTFMTSVFWGQLSLCEVVLVSVRHYSCENKFAYRMTCFFSSVMFLFQVSNIHVSLRPLQIISNPVHNLFLYRTTAFFYYFFGVFSRRRFERIQ
jgi:hypothetical protein